MENIAWLPFQKGTQQQSLLGVVEKRNVTHPVPLMHTQSVFFLAVLVVQTVFCVLCAAVYYVHGVDAVHQLSAAALNVLI